MGIQPGLSSKVILYGIRSTFFLSCIIHLGYGDTNEQFRNCSHLYNCGSIQGIGYPFWGEDRPSYCGSQAFRLNCYEQRTTLWIDKQLYVVLRVGQSIPKIRIARTDLSRDPCPFPINTYLRDSTFPDFKFKTETTVLNIFYGCTSEVISRVQARSNVTCKLENGESGVLFTHPFVSRVEGCYLRLQVPILLTAYHDLWDGKITLGTALSLGFDVHYNFEVAACSACEASGGKCGSDSADKFICICPDQSYPVICLKHRKNGLPKPIIGAIVAGIVLSACLIIWYRKYKECLDGSIILFYKRKTVDDQNIEAIIKQYGSLTPRRYSYSDIKKITNSFREKLGQGGYGDVYKGYLSNSRPVAVKILKTTKGNGEEFINEVASISRTAHVNIVTLLGFCLDGRKKALIYEFLSNGSLEKYIRKESDDQLGLERLYEISIGIARGLEYLHRGCNTRILHFDIKPQNILLDDDFCPKISDFGLAKLCARKESIVSMLGARGTIGYIAPEVFSRSFGGVSYKSDVYSYGMMVLEMVGGRRNATNVEMSNSSAAYFPRWVYQRVMLDEDLKLKDHVMTKEEDEIARKMIIVGLWCIQIDPSQRPSMSKVIDMLEGSLEDLELPPKHFLCSSSTPENVSVSTALLSSYQSSVADSFIRSP